MMRAEVNKAGHPRSVLVWGGLLALCLVWLLTLAPQALAGNVASADGNGYQGADYWRDVTGGKAGYTTNQNVEGGVLINRGGEHWRQLRNDEIKPSGTWALGLTLVALVAGYLLLGRNRLREPRTGRTLERWRRVDRYLHWAVAGLFIVLALTGLSVLYGRHFLPGVLGQEGFGAWMQGAKFAHNYLGPVFVVCLALMVIKWLKNNFFNRTDLAWFAQGGGLIKGKHPHAGYLNGAEKVWFWLLVIGGVAVSVSGLALDFPAYLGLREDLQLANVVHAIGSLALTCVALAHIYIGTVGTEGALEGMVTGHVDEAWAKQHHDLWYQEVNGGDKTRG